MAAKRYGAWQVLGLDATHDERAIKRAYAAKLKAIDPDTDRQSFLDLRAAFEGAKREAQWLKPPPEKAEEKQPSLADPSLDFRPENLRAAPSGRILRNKPVEAREKIRVTAANKSEDEAPQKARLRGKRAKTPELTETAPTKARIKTKPSTADVSLDDAAGKVHVSFGKAEPEHSGFQIAVASPWVESEADGAKLDACLSRLSRLIRRNKGQPVDEGEIEATFLQLLEAPELDNVGRREQVESQIAEMAIRAKERGHFLLLLANWHFEWYKRADDFDLVWPLSEVAELAPAVQKLRNMQGKLSGQSSDPDHKAYTWLQSPPPSRWNPLFWMRRSAVIGLLQRARRDTPRLTGLMGHDKINAWESIAFSGWRLVTLFSLLVYGGLQWAWTSLRNVGPDPTLAVIGAVLFVTTIATALIFAERAETQRLEENTYHYAHAPPMRPFAALAAMGLLTLLFGLLPVHPWIAVASVPLTMGLFYLTDISLLRSPDRERSFVIARRFTIGAFLITIGLREELDMVHVQQVFVPALFFCWAAARLHDPLQIKIDQQHKVQRWQLQLAVWLASVACLGLWTFAPNIMPDWQAFLLYFAAMLVVVLHDMITPREAEIPGTHFLILPIITAVLAVRFPVPVMLTLVMIRCLPIFQQAWKSRQRALESGRTWHDRGGGYNSGTDFSNFTFFGFGGQKEEGKSGLSGWQIFGLIFVGIQVIRLLAMLGG